MLTKRVNKIKVKPVVSNIEYNKHNTKGYKMFKEPYANILLIAKKKSGKSTVIYNILKECASKGTQIIIICPSFGHDKTYQKMERMLNKKGCEVTVFDGIKDSEDPKIDNVAEITNALLANNGTEGSVRDAGSVGGGGVCLFGDEDIEEKSGKVIKPEDRKNGCRTILIADDLGSSLRCQSIYRLLLKNRHLKMKTIISTHSVNDLIPSAYPQIDDVLLFDGIGDEKIKEAREKLKLEIPGSRSLNNDFIVLYKDACGKKYDFLYCDRNEHTYRRNFDEEYQF